MPDTATISLQNILNGGDYELVRDVPVFDEHDEYDAKGQLARRFDAAKLTQIARTSNARRRTGDLAPIGAGHTVTDQYDPATRQLLYKAKETDQPPIWGYVGEFKVGRYGPGGKLAIVADFYMRRKITIETPNGERTLSGRQALEEFPRRSIELWYADDTIDWVALLRRTPQRDLGLTAAASMYARDLQTQPWNLIRERVFGDKGCSNRLAAAYSAVGKLRYSMDSASLASSPADQDAAVGGRGPTRFGMDPTTLPDPNANPDQANLPDPNGLPPDQAAMADKYMAHYEKKHSWIKACKSKYGMEQPATPAPIPGADGSMPPMPGEPMKNAAFPAAMNAAPPGGAVPPPSPDDKDKDKFGRNGTPSRYERENVQLRQQNAELIKRLDVNERLGRYEKELVELQRDGYDLSVDEELATVVNFDASQFASYKDRIVRRYNKAPVSREMADLGPAPVGGEITQSAGDAIIMRMRRDKVDFATAKAAYQAGQP